jgi:hypothetical protein
MGLFDDLSDYDFELLVADLLGAELGTRFETFPRGRDGGIDLRARKKRRLHVVQCKHYAGSTFSKLRTAAKREPAHFLDAVPDRYTFVTSRPLTADNKAKLVEALSPLVSDESDIFGADDLAQLLRKHTKVEVAHVKLWLRSIAPLERIVNADVLARSEVLLNEIRSGLPRYVQTRSFAEARKLLHAHNVVIIAGPPGIGKTTLARLLLLDSTEAGFAPYSVQSDITEAWQLFKADEAQVFFFDDFLGRTALFEGVGRDARDLATFINAVRARPAARLILATREYVLQQAQQQVEDLKWKQLEAERYALTLERYSRVERARIFYNHVFFSPYVNAQARKSLRANRGYLRVIDHPSYSPRLIEWMTGLGGQQLGEAELRKFGAFCIRTLNEPEKLWAHAYSKGLGRREQCVLVQLCALPRAVTVADLERAYINAARLQGLPTRRAQFEEALRILQDSFMRIIRVSGQDAVQVLNPSLIDFVKARLVDDVGMLREAMESATYFDQVEFLAEIARDYDLRLPDWAKMFSEAVKRTLDVEYEGTVQFPGWGVPRRDAEYPTALEGRLERAAMWCQRDDSVRQAIGGVVSDDVIRVLEGIEKREQPEWTIKWAPRLLRTLQAAGIGVSDAVLLAKRIAERRTDTDAIESFETLADLRRIEPGAFSEEEWQELQDGFEQWGEEAMADPNEWFDDPEAFESFQGAAVRLGVAFSDDSLEAAKEAIDQRVAEQQEHAMEQVSREEMEDEREREDRRDLEPDDTAKIDAMFEMFRG